MAERYDSLRLRIALAQVHGSLLLIQGGTTAWLEERDVLSRSHTLAIVRRSDFLWR